MSKLFAAEYEIQRPTRGTVKVRAERVAGGAVRITGPKYSTEYSREHQREYRICGLQDAAELAVLCGEV
jgi:hypothetical protein